MVDHYMVLGVPQSADQRQIKSAFKRLAFRYHPDRNPDNPEAEERFKEINLAYQVLSDPHLRAQYDVKLQYGTPEYSQSPRRPPPYTTRRSYYDYDPFKRPSTPGKAGGYYEVGWKYVKHQALAFAFVFVVALLYLTVKGIIDYRNQKAYEALIAERDQQFSLVQTEFREGEYRSSFNLLSEITKNYPTTGEIVDYRLFALKELTRIADDSLASENYKEAVSNYNIVREYSQSLNPELYQKMAVCYKNLGEYERAAQVLDYILIRDFENLQLNLEIASIYRDILKQPGKALEYYDRAKKRVKEQLINTYGEAYEIVMNPRHSPPIYYRVFFNSAINSSLLEDHDMTIKDCNWSVFFRSDLPDAYYMRAVSYMEIGKQAKACRDWTKAAELGYRKAAEALTQYCN